MKKLISKIKKIKLFNKYLQNKILYEYFVLNREENNKFIFYNNDNVKLRVLTITKENSKFIDLGIFKGQYFPVIKIKENYEIEYYRLLTEDEIIDYFRVVDIYYERKNNVIDGHASWYSKLYFKIVSKDNKIKIIIDSKSFNENKQYNDRINKVILKQSSIIFLELIKKYFYKKMDEINYKIKKDSKYIKNNIYGYLFVDEDLILRKREIKIN